MHSLDGIYELSVQVAVNSDKMMAFVVRQVITS